MYLCKKSAFSLSSIQDLHCCNVNLWSGYATSVAIYYTLVIIDNLLFPVLVFVKS